MQTYTDLSLDSGNAYKLAELIDKGQYNNILYYEFHQEVNPKQINNCLEGLEDFQKETKNSKRIFFSHGFVDELPAIIHVAVKVADEWFIARECGSNFYLGYGPTGIIELRNACLKKGIKGFILTENFDNWLKNKFVNAKAFLTHEGKGQDKEQFNHILKIIRYLTVEMQNQPQEYQDLNEENIRAKMKMPLSVIFQGRVFAEAKNCNGKTDLLIKTEDGLNEHIFELKVWKGIKTIHEAIEQIGGYLGSHNNFCGIIVFSNNKSFTKVLNETEQYLRINFSLTSREKENEFRITIPHKKDEMKAVTMHFVFINLRF